MLRFATVSTSNPHNHNEFYALSHATWEPASWKQKTAKQQPTYQQPAELDAVLETLTARPPLVTSWEIERLKGDLARAARGEAFLLQGGDCSERFADCKADPIEQKLKLLLQMSLVLVHGLQKPCLLYTSPSPRDATLSRMPSSA